MMSETAKFPFTASQWQELEHQALIFKYMVSGIPIPSDLLFTIKRSCLDSPLSSKLFPRQPSHIGWSCFQMGLGRKIDPEPGRCRRTDGKKWRCSKEAYPDSKYCERHMHRGKNRSRKPVEVPTQTVTANPSITTQTISSINKNHSSTTTLLGNTPLPSHSLSLLSSETHHQNHHLHYSAPYHAHLNNHQFLSSSSRPPGNIGLSHQDNSTPLLLDSAPGSGSLTNTADYRKAYGMKEEVDEHAFFSSEPSGSMRSLSGGSSLDDAWQFTPLTMNSSSTSSSNQRGLSSLNNEYSYLQLHSLSDHDSTPKQQKMYHQRSYLLGNEMKCQPPMKVEREEQPQKTVHRFFDEWPPKNKDSWLDLDDKSPNSTSVSTTRLSISIPSSHDFPIFNSRTHNDG
ncbi:growth-regulating factor 1 isoform X2 [Jatropha curcas]|uniref:growth-regulating factor 1 isoform X2 n=1 Tax=Jatropha curcas TaxID=180498 RepID=UPI0005FC2455|nr:growth-regulating factor 1 isoform X2 [Jatropha curcas]